jgi:Leucine-rich repeat (LRR) protein
MVNLPRQLGNLSNLRMLDLRTCKRLETLPPSLGQLTKLEVLDISDCVDLVIPKSLEKFKDIAVGWDAEKVE